MGAHGGITEQLPRQSTVGPDAKRYTGEAVDQIEQLIAAGRAPVAFICETVYGNAGGMALPGRVSRTGLRHAVRGGGGYAVADEVQVGYGWLGDWFWGFQQQGAGARHRVDGEVDGQRLSARCRRHEPRDRRRLPSQGYFFSSTGGSPLSCAIGMTVLTSCRRKGCRRTQSCRRAPEVTARGAGRQASAHRYCTAWASYLGKSRDGA